MGSYDYSPSKPCYTAKQRCEYNNIPALNYMINLYGEASGKPVAKVARKKSKTSGVFIVYKQILTGFSSTEWMATTGRCAVIGH